MNLDPLMLRHFKQIVVMSFTFYSLVRTLSLLLFLGIIINSHYGSTLRSDARITVNGELSLAGILCPGLVNITCIGTYLTSLQWKYDNMDIGDEFLPNDPIQNAALPFPFMSVALIRVSQYPNPRFANFTSVLTAELQQLEQANIRILMCGDLLTENVLALNFSIQEEIIPNKPQINGIVATYESAQLDRIQVTWTRSTVKICSGQSLNYTVTISHGTLTWSKEINLESCGERNCSISFENLSLFTTSSQLQHVVSLTVQSSTGLRSISTNPHPIDTDSNGYLSLSHNFTNCTLNAVCTSPAHNEQEHTLTLCAIKYKKPHENEDMYSQELIVNLGEQFTLPDYEFNIQYTASATIGEGFHVVISGEIPPPILLPEEPRIATMTALYANRGQLEQLDVTWTKVTKVCSTNESMDDTINYRASINGVDGELMSSLDVRSEDCRRSVCSAKFILSTELSSAFEFRITLYASNLAGSSNIDHHEPIYRMSASYYLPTVMLLNCTALYIACSAPPGLFTYHNQCLLHYYGDDSQHNQLETELNITINGNGEVVTIVAATEHYLSLTLALSSTLQIQEYFVYSTRHICTTTTQDEAHSDEPQVQTGTEETFTLSTEVIIGITAGSASILICLMCLALGTTCYCAIARRNRTNGKERGSNTETHRSMNYPQQERQPSPVYEEIDELQAGQHSHIELKTNSAYAKSQQSFAIPQQQNTGATENASNTGADYENYKKDES